MAHESKVYINTESYYPGHKRLPTDLPIEVTGDGTLENPYVPVSGGISSIVPGSGIAVDATDPANPEVSASGGSGYLVATVELTNAQIKALPTSDPGAQIVAAPGVGKYLKIFGAQIIADTLAAAYTNVSLSGLIKIQLAGAAQAHVVNNGILEQEDIVYGDLAPDAGVNVQPLNIIENSAIVIQSHNDGGNYTGGNAANTLEAVVYYIIVDL